MSHVRRTAASLATAAFIAGSLIWVNAQQGARAVAIDPDDIGGIVAGPKGPEAGVWVIAEATDLPTKFARIVVTDDQGRYVLPDLPRGTYQVFARGYGLIDSTRVNAAPGQQLNLTARAAPDARAAAQIYPANYWLGLARIPAGKLETQRVASAIKGCLGCHQLGDRATREIPTTLGPSSSSLEVWDRRVKSGQIGAMMSANFMNLGPQRAMFSEWTDRVAAGAVPQQAPARPTGVERNVVISMWDWGRPTSYVHDAVASDKRDPTLNANGLVYGAVQSDDTLAWINPVEHTTGEIAVGTRDAPNWSAEVLFGRPTNVAPSPYWGDEVLWKAAAEPRNPTADHRGRLWMSVAIRAPRNQPNFCKPGSMNKFAQYFPISQGGIKQIAMYDPRNKQGSQIDTCFPTEHFDFAEDRDHTLFTGQGNVVSWLNTRVYDETHNDEAAQGWCPAVLDTNGDGKITDWTEPDQPADPKKDHRINFGCYSIGLNPADGSVWCGGGGAGMVRLERGPNPPQTCKAEVYAPPAGVVGAGHVDVATDGVVWANWRGSDHMTSFDRRKCKVLNGPSATGPHCPEGWTVHKKPGPTFQGTDISADLIYLTVVDKFDTLGLGKNVPLGFAVNSDSLVVPPMAGRPWTTLRVPYPLGYFTRALNGRVDDARSGWKGRGLWSNFSPYGPLARRGRKRHQKQTSEVPGPFQSA